MRKLLVSLVASSALGLSALGQLVDPGGNGMVKRTATNATTIAIAGTDYQLPFVAVQELCSLAAQMFCVTQRLCRRRRWPKRRSAEMYGCGRERTHL